MERSPAEQRVLHTFFDGDRLVLMPTRRAKRLVVLDQVAQLFELGRTCPEHGVNALLAPIHPDVPALRRRESVRRAAAACSTAPRRRCCAG